MSPEAKPQRSITIILAGFFGHAPEPLVLTWGVEADDMELYRWAELIEKDARTWASGIEEVRLKFRGKRTSRPGTEEASHPRPAPSRTTTRG